jgi:hypothetical protein
MTPFCAFRCKISINSLIFIVHGQGLDTDECSALAMEPARQPTSSAKTVDLGKCRVSLTGNEPLNLTVLRLPISLSTMQLATCRRPERDSDGRLRLEAFNLRPGRSSFPNCSSSAQRLRMPFSSAE